MDHAHTKQFPNWAYMAFSVLFSWGRFKADNLINQPMRRKKLGFLLLDSMILHLQLGYLVLIYGFY